MKTLQFFCCLLLLVASHNPIIGCCHQELPTGFIYPWPNFCLGHLQEDPEGCSSWISSKGEESEKKICLEEENFTLFPYASISPELLEQFRNEEGFAVLPSLPQSRCDYGICVRCQERLIRSVSWIEKTDWDEEEESQSISYAPKIAYKCNCTDDFVYKDDETFQDVVSEWKFCGKPACFAGYFDKHLSAYFLNFCSFAHYCNENPSCDCYWFEKQEFRKNVLDLIDHLFWETLLEGVIYMDMSCPVSFEALLKLMLFPLRKFMEHLVHSVFYTDLRDSIREFDRAVFRANCGNYRLDNRISQIKWDTFYETLIEQIRPLFLEEYKRCYNKHPHPKIAAEIKTILDEIQEMQNPSFGRALPYQKEVQKKFSIKGCPIPRLTFLGKSLVK